MRLSLFKAAVLVAASLSVAAPALAKPRASEPAPRGERLYTTIDQHNPARFSKAVRIASDSLSHGGRSAEILLGGRAVLMLVPGYTDVQKEILQAKRKHRNLNIVACKETIDMLRRSNRGRMPPMISGVRIESCTGRSRKNDSAGWQRMLGV